MRPFVGRAMPLLLLPLLAGLGGCATTGAPGVASGTSPDLISQEELVPLQQLDGLQVVQRLRPRWLRVRAGALPEVVVDGSRIEGQANALRNYRVGEIRELRYLSPSDATLRFGTGFPAGAIVVTTGR